MGASLPGGEGVGVMKVLHVITGLSIGGAETMLYKLLSSWDQNRFSGEVVSLVPAGPIGPKIADLGIPVRSLNMRPGLPSPFAILKLAWRIRAFAPQLIQTWMEHANLLGGLAAKLAGRHPVIWGIRNGALEPGKDSATGIWSAKTCARLSRSLPMKILCCSESARQIHQTLGYDPEKMCVIPNGFDLEQFKPDPKARLAVRAELNVNSRTLLVGLIARFDPFKDHATFIRISALLKDRWPQLHFILCGDGIDWTNVALKGLIEEAGVGDRFHLLGRRNDMPSVTAALDVSCLCSRSEAFPNVLGEAMACGVPCVVTDVGDCAMIVSDTGIVSAPGDAQGLARGVERILELGQGARQKLGESARSRIRDNFSLDRVVKQYEKLYQEVAAKRTTVTSL
jgi:glycosyltransferase involved in cell wall biosynthesis